MIVKTAVKQTDGLWDPREKDCVYTGVLPKLNDNPANSTSSWNPINHWNMNWSQFKDPLSYCYLCLGGTMVASWSLTLETVSLNPFVQVFMTNIFRRWILRIQWKHFTLPQNPLHEYGCWKLTTVPKTTGFYNSWNNCKNESAPKVTFTANPRQPGRHVLLQIKAAKPTWSYNEDLHSNHLSDQLSIFCSLIEKTWQS